MRLGLEPDLEVVGAVASADALLDAAMRTTPDVLLLDVRMPPEDGLAQVPRLRRALPALRIVVLSLHDERATRTQSAAVGVDAFVAKGDGDTALLAAIRDLHGRASAHRGGADLRPSTEADPDDRPTAPPPAVRSVSRSRRRQAR